MDEEYRTAEEIRQEIAKLKLRLAFQQDFEDEVGTLRGNAFPARVKRLCDGLKTRTEPSTPPRRRTAWHIPKGGRIVAAVLFVLMVGAGSAAAALQMASVGLLGLSAQSYPDHTSYSLTYTGKTIEVPESWEGSFYPAYIPEGFVYRNSATSEVIYADASKRALSFSENGVGSSVDYDTENAKITAVELNGAEATLIEKEEWVTVIWLANNRLFSIDMQGSAEEALMVAASVIMIR